MGIDAVADAFADVIPCAKEHGHTITRTYLDTFDWRLFGRNAVLVAEPSDEGQRLDLRTRYAGELLGSTLVPEAPRFAWDFPDGPLRGRLGPAIKMRALLPRIKLRVQVHALKCHNREDKTILTVLHETYMAEDPESGTRKRLQDRLRVVPVRGYNRPLEKALRILEHKLQLLPAPEDVMVTALTAIGRRAGDYSSKLQLSVDPSARADEGTKSILRHLLETMRINEPGTRDDLDTEFLHDFRVSVRRTRSALGQIKRVLPQSQIDRFRAEFAWLQQVTGPTRDMDVYLLKFDRYRSSLPQPVQAHLDPLHDFLVRHQRLEHEAMVRTLDSARYRRLLRSWERYLDRPLPKRPTAGNAMRPMGELAGERIWRAYRRVMKEGGEISDSSPAEMLHELRKSCKKLRYLMEFFRSIYLSGQIEKLIAALKGLQDNLGDFQDLHVQAESLKEFGEQMKREGGASPDTLAAMHMLIQGLDERQQAARAEFAARFKRFCQPRNRKLFTRLFKTPPGRAAA